MYPALEAIIHQAEDHYLQSDELTDFSSHISSLRERLETYELIRDHEILIFQAVADKMLENFPQEKPQQVERSLKHWLLITRYCAMAMLLNNHEFLERRLLEWLTDIVSAYELQLIQNTLFQLLANELEKVLSENQVEYIQPFLEQAKTTLLNTEVAFA